MSSYFNKNKYENAKTRLLVRKIHDIRYFVVNTEFDALLLENNMIKKYQPRYNIQLKDDKTYPFICVKNERFPRIFPTRNLVRDGSEYFGPYASVKMMNTLLELIRQLYPLRTCTYMLSEENIKAGKFKVCLEYHVKNCLGPCEGLQSEEDYLESISDVKSILRGHIQEVMGHLKKKMQEHAVALEYEKANLIKDKLEILNSFKGKSTVVSPGIKNLDVFSFLDDGDQAFVNYLKVVNGAIIQGHTVEIKRKLDESGVEILLLAITELRDRFKSSSREVIVPFKLGLTMPGVKFHIPQRGDKRKLLELSERNAKFFKLDKLRRIEKVDPEGYSRRVLNQLRVDLRLLDYPDHIECFDNSNIQGTESVAACVVFRNGKPSKKEYRHFNIKTVEGPDDFASMREIVLRRYKRLLEEEKPLPQLIVIDGGKGQLNAAVESLEYLQLRGKIGIVGIAKKLEEIYFPEDPVPLYIDKRSESLKLIQQLRNEAHRFGIEHHRNKRSKKMLDSGLLEVPGVGKATEKVLLKKFRTVKKLREASQEELESILGSKRGSNIYRRLHQFS